ncbi:MAG: NAD(P)-dependent oxidoreductase [Flavobacteriaceae bacterium]|nr:NAD(P)-dependent oxidoreductase [Flavobacteriaceae bacterium]
MKIDKSTNVLIFGCGGMLGDSVYRLFSENATVLATDLTPNEEWLSFADVRDYDSVKKVALDFKPDLIINLAALTDLEYCEKNPENTWLTNALGPENTALIADYLDIPLVYISTAGIVDGLQDVYNDFDKPNPLSLYAKAKYHGELFTTSFLKKHFVFRAGWMMGGGPQKDKKFINKLFKQLNSGAKELFVVDDKLGTPTYTKSFAKGILNVVESGLYGVYNQVCEGECSRYDVAKEFVKLLDLDNTVKITKVDSDYFKSDYFATRPASEKLVNLKLGARGLNVMPHWKDALEAYSTEFIKELKK